MDSIGNNISTETRENISPIFMSLGKRDYDEYLNLLGDCFSSLRSNNSSSQMVDHILTEADPEGDADNSFIAVVKNFAADPLDIKYVVQNSESLSDIRYMMTQIVETPSFGQIFNTLMRAYEDNFDVDDLVELKNYMLEYESKTNYKITTAIEFVEVMINEYAEKPSWVSILDGESNSLLHTTPSGLDLEAKASVMEKVRKEAKKLKATPEIDQAMAFFESTISDNLAENDSFTKSFRVWGPENRYMDRECPSNKDMKGGCRMFTCMCREEEDSNEWFTGRCDVTNKRIKNISHAIRYPVKGGGWKGCFSSFKAMLEDPPYQMNGEDHVRVKQLRLNLSNYGVMDRSL